MMADRGDGPEDLLLWLALIMLWVVGSALLLRRPKLPDHLSET